MILYNFLAGAAAFGHFACSLFFFRFWRRTREELFLAFAASFALLGLGQTIVTLAQMPTEEKGALYLVRLLAFLLIITAIYRKNRPSRSA